ncbi:MAG: UTRA domain-containing protein [Burkholderiaceae bacterium]|nr:UTRA domain-containing protein [Burkholderiaceae bacterium]
MSMTKLPVYEQVKTFIKAQITLGVWRAARGRRRAQRDRVATAVCRLPHDREPGCDGAGEWACHNTQVLKVKSLREDVALATLFKLPVGVEVFYTVMVHFENSVSIQLEDRHANPVTAPDYLGVDFTTTTPTHYLLEHAPLTEAHYSNEACLPRPLEAKSLDLKKSEPCLVLTRSAVSGLHVASLAQLVYPGLRYCFHCKFEL